MEEDKKTITTLGLFILVIGAVAVSLIFLSLFLS